MTNASRKLPRNSSCSHRPVAGQTKVAFTRNERLTEPWLQDTRLCRSKCLLNPSASRGFRGFHVLAVFAEARFAVAPGAMMERLLRDSDVRLIASPSFKHWSL